MNQKPEQPPIPRGINPVPPKRLAGAIKHPLPSLNSEEIKSIFCTRQFKDEFGTIRLAEWPEGLVLWVGGQIRWRSWFDPDFENVRK